jgi:hypothetical protein
VQPRFLYFERTMKPKSRDNLIYLGVGLGIVALLVVDLIYTESHGREMWMPSKFAFRIVGSTGILAYLLGKKMHQGRATLVQILVGVLLAIVVHVGIIFKFRQAADQLSTISFSPFVILEMFFVAVLSEQAVLRLIPRQRKHQP